MSETPGKAAHDAYCADDDWDLLDEAEHDLWVHVEMVSADAVNARRVSAGMGT
jgi:hypothetical protein